VFLAPDTYLSRMFKKKVQKADDIVARADDLQARRTDASERLEKLRIEAINAARTAPDKLAALSEAAARPDFEIAALTEAIREVEQEAEQAAEAARREADQRQRQQTSRDLRRLASDLEKAVLPLPGAMRTLHDAITASLPVIGLTQLPDLLTNLSVELPAAIELFAGEIRARADQTIAGTAPPNMPAPPALVLIEEPLEMPETSIFSLERLSWLDDHGVRRNCGPFEIHGLPTRLANIALERRLAILPDSDRYKAMRAEAEKTGFPHQLDPMKTYDLSHDPNLTAVYSSGGKETTFTRVDRGPARQVFVARPEPQPNES
jgi:hypothetical protein